MVVATRALGQQASEGCGDIEIPNLAISARALAARASSSEASSVELQQGLRSDIRELDDASSGVCASNVGTQSTRLAFQGRPSPRHSQASPTCEVGHLPQTDGAAQELSETMNVKASASARIVTGAGPLPLHRTIGTASAWLGIEVVLREDPESATNATMEKRQGRTAEAHHTTGGTTTTPTTTGCVTTWPPTLISQWWRTSC
mmetsp:Transcript_57499/g.186565  ORF Transcript_57499/g.186565 Transcript_57499/m.186565 type:complete len:203 (-) Transcript_57499:142-750(-)